MSNAFFHSSYGNLKKNDNVSLPGYTWYFTKKMYSFSFVRNEKCIARDFLFFYVNASHFIYYDIPILNKWWRATCQFGAVLWLRFHKENHAGFGHFARNTGIEKGRMTDGRHVNSRWCAWQGPTLSSQKENGWITVTWSFLERTKCRPAPPDCGVEFTGCRLVGITCWVLTSSGPLRRATYPRKFIAWSQGLRRSRRRRSRRPNNPAG